MVKKVKPEPAIATWEKADQALEEIGKRVALIERHEAEANAEIDRIKSTLGEKTMGHIARVLRLEKDLQEFLEAHREELGEAKSKVLNFGTMGFRSSPGKLKLAYKVTWEKVVERIRELGYPDHWLRCPDPQPDKDKIKNEATGEQVSAHGQKGESVFSQIDRFRRFARNKSR